MEAYYTKVICYLEGTAEEEITLLCHMENPTQLQEKINSDKFFFGYGINGKPLGIKTSLINFVSMELCNLDDPFFFEGKKVNEEEHGEDQEQKA